MIFFETLYFVLLSLSLTAMWSFSEIFTIPRHLISRIPYIRRPLSCPECSSFWFGLMLSFIYNPICFDHPIPFLANIFCGLVSYLFSHFLLMKKNIDNNLKFVK
jgi:hypothetical protein